MSYRISRNPRESENVHRSRSRRQERPRRGLCGGAGGEDIVDEQNRFSVKRTREASVVGRGNVRPARCRGKPRLGRPLLRLLQHPRSKRNPRLAGDGSRDELRLVEPALPLPSPRERNRNHRRGAFELSRSDPGAAGATPEDRRDSTAASELQRVKAEADVVDVWRLRARAAEVAGRAPAGTAKTGSDPRRVRKTAARTKRLPDAGNPIETPPAERPLERECERGAAQETNRRENESSEPLKSGAERVRPDQARPTQGMDQVGAG